MNYAKWFAEIARKIRELAGIPQQLAGIRQSIEEQGKATRAAYEGNQQQDREQWRRVEVRFTDDEIGKIKADRESQRSTQKSIMRAAWCTFWAATFYGVVTVFLWLNARDQLEMEQRSWLLFDPNYSDTMQLGADNTDVSVPFRLVNIGKTPARAINGFAIVEELKKGEQPTFVYYPDRAAPIRSGMLYPGPEYDQTTAINEFTDGHKSVSVTGTKRKQFKDEAVVFNVWGRLTYFDVFQQQHLVQFCHAIAQSPSAKTNGCVNYNLVDAPSRWPSIKAIFRR
jgi:hypothetical protein